MQGQIDLVTPEWAVEGWCWDEAAPDEPVSLSIRLNGAEVGSTVACLFREDLSKAGIGDGYHFFRFLLPIAVLNQSRTQVITLVDSHTGAQVGEPYRVRAEEALSFDERLRKLEARNRLLEGRLAELTRSKGYISEQGEVFAVVGAFFERLSRDLAQGLDLTPHQQLGETIAAITRTHPPLDFEKVERPAVSVFVEAGYALNQVYPCLAAIRRATADVSVEVTVLDTGAFDETALVPSIARRVRYIRATSDLVAEWGQAARNESSAILVFLDGQAMIGGSFLSEVARFFDVHARVGAVAGGFADPDGTVHHGGLLLVAGALEPITGTEQATESLPVHAMSRGAAAFRRDAVEAVGGLDPIFGDDLGAAVVDLCFRLRQAGWSIVSHPRAAVTLSPGWEETRAPPSVSGRSWTMDLLEQRWLSLSTDAHPPLTL